MSLIKLSAGNDEYWLLNDIPHQRGQFDISTALNGDIIEIYNLNTLKSLARGKYDEFSPDGVTAYGSLTLLIDDLKTFFFKSSGGGGTTTQNGFIDYNDTTGNVNITANTWTTIPNNGLGSFTNKNYPPTGVNELMDTSTGAIDTTELVLGDTIIIRNDFKINPNTNNALLEFRYQLGAGAGLYTLESIVSRLDSGSGQDYRFSLKPDLIYIGDENTRLNPISLQVRLSTNGIILNAGTVIQVIKR